MPRRRDIGGPARARTSSGCGEGLYILDEPEAALSVTGAISLLTIVARAYDDLDSVRLTRGFLEAPKRYLRAALDSG